MTSISTSLFVRYIDKITDRYVYVSKYRISLFNNAILATPIIPTRGFGLGIIQAVHTSEDALILVTLLLLSVHQRATESNALFERMPRSGRRWHSTAKILCDNNYERHPLWCHIQRVCLIA
jgi:hypothetical protein